jgi:hypothetical protein
MDAEVSRPDLERFPDWREVIQIRSARRSLTGGFDVIVIDGSVSNSIGCWCVRPGWVMPHTGFEVTIASIFKSTLVLVSPQTSCPRQSNTKANQHVNRFSSNLAAFSQAINQNRKCTRDSVADIRQVDGQAFRGDLHPATKLVEHFPGCLMHQVLVDICIGHVAGGQDLVYQTRNRVHGKIDQA